MSFVRGGAVVVRWPLVIEGRPPDLSDVEHLARLQLVAHQLGGSISVQLFCPILRSLVELAGLIEVVGDAELGEEIGVEEEVQPDDPVA